MVDDVAAAVSYCEKQFGWGPFYQFTAPVPNASYKAWRGEKVTEVALGMAGQVQMEFLHVHKGHDTTADYQDAYGRGFQHIGIGCKSRDAALAHLEALGASVNELNEYPGVNFAFVDVPTGPGMFEILQPTEQMKPDSSLKTENSREEALLKIDRATIVTRNMEQALAFYAASFGWGTATATSATLHYGASQTTVQRYIGEAGKLQLELIEPQLGSDDPYAQHLYRGDHGLVHAGGVMHGQIPEGESITGQWSESGERFALYDWAGGQQALQIRLPR